MLNSWYHTGTPLRRKVLCLWHQRRGAQSSTQVLHIDQNYFLRLLFRCDSISWFHNLAWLTFHLFLISKYLGYPYFLRPLINPIMSVAQCTNWTTRRRTKNTSSANNASSASNGGNASNARNTSNASSASNALTSASVSRLWNYCYNLLYIEILQQWPCDPTKGVQPVHGQISGEYCLVKLTGERRRRKKSTVYMTNTGNLISLGKIKLIN